jgi:Ca2+-binding EF-hand superfamily protein
MSFSDNDLRAAVDKVFDVYDADKSGTLEVSEVTKLINDALTHMKHNRQVSEQEVKAFISAVDTSGDGKIQKPELFEIFKKVINN